MNINIGSRVKELRLTKGMTQSELAERIGMTSSAISSYEIGERQPSYDVLIKIAKLFNVTTDYLLGHTNKDMMSISGLMLGQRQHVQSMVEAYQKFNHLCIITFDLEREEVGIDYPDTKLYYLDAIPLEELKEAIDKRVKK